MIMADLVHFHAQPSLSSDADPNCCPFFLVVIRSSVVLLGLSVPLSLALYGCLLHVASLDRIPFWSSTPSTIIKQLINNYFY